MHIYVNGEQHYLADNLSLAELVSRLEIPSNRVAIELNKTVIRRQEWDLTRLHDEDRVEIVHFVGGGGP